MMRTAAMAGPTFPPARTNSSSNSSKGSFDSNGNRKISSKSTFGRLFKSTKDKAKDKDSKSSYVPGSSVRRTSSGTRGSLLKKQTSFNGSIMSGMSDMSGSTLSMSSSSRRSSTSSSSNRRRSSKVSQFVRDGTSKSQCKVLWGDSGSGEGTDIVDTTSEESNGSNSPTYERYVNNSHMSPNNNNSFTALNSSFASLGEDHSPGQLQLQEMPPLPLPPPIKKSVRFCQPLVTMCVEVESSWMIWGYGKQMAAWTQEYKDQQLREKGKTKATLLDGSHLWISKEALAAYDPKPLLEAQPTTPQFLNASELKALRHQKERLCKYRRKLKKKLRAKRQARCDRMKQLAEECIVGYQARHTRIINRYKMAAPNAIEHRRRRQIKFALAAQAKTVWLVQQRQRHLLAIRRTANARLERIRQQQLQMNIGLPHYHIRHQMKRIMVHQASMKALIRLQRNQIQLNEVEGKPLVYPLERKPDEYYDDSDSDDDDDDDDLDTDDYNFRRLEWAIVSFLASANSKRFGRDAGTTTSSKDNDSVNDVAALLTTQEEEEDEDDDFAEWGHTSVEI